MDRYIREPLTEPVEARGNTSPVADRTDEWGKTMLKVVAVLCCHTVVGPPGHDVAPVAHAAIGAVCVDASAVHTRVVKIHTLIDVWA
jgi:hypothetical protein